MEETRGQKLRRMRKERNLTIGEVAAAIGVSKGFMSLLEKDKSGIRSSRALELAKFFGVDVKEIIDVDITEVVGTEPKWVSYLKEKFHPAQYVLDICKDMVKNAGLPESSALESDEEFERRWDFFYQSILRFLDNPNYQFFADPLVRQALKNMQIPNCGNWVDIVRRVDEIMNERLGAHRDFRDGESWRKYVEEMLSISSHILKATCVDELLSQILIGGTPQDLIGGAAMVFGSSKLYAAIYSNSTKVQGSSAVPQYHFIQDLSGEKSYRASFPFWHEAARVLIDPGLTLGKGAEYIPDGETMPPIERLIERIAARMAFAFTGFTDMIHDRPHFSVADVVKIKDKVYKDSTIRMAAIAACELSADPMVYVDAYLRLKKDECDDLGVTVTDVEAMRKHQAAKLRVGYIFKNAIAESREFNVRYNLRVGKNSPVYKSFYDKRDVAGEDNLAEWDSKYHLNGLADVNAHFSHENTRAFFWIKG